MPILFQPRLTLPGETLLMGLHKVPPATSINFNAAGFSKRRFWSLTSTPHPHSFAETKTHIRELIQDIVNDQIITNIPCGAMLSGGVDSTSVES